MKKKTFFIAVLIAVVSELTSCNTKQADICRLEKLTRDLYLKSNSYTPEQWTQASEKYDAVSADLSEHESEMTSQEKLYVKKLEAECYAFFGKNKANGLWEDIKEVMKGE